MPRHAAQSVAEVLAGRTPTWPVNRPDIGRLLAKL
jgi:hypothetical protein